MQFTELSEAFVLKRLRLGSADMKSNPTGQRKLKMIILKLTGRHSKKTPENLKCLGSTFLSSKTKLSFTLQGKLNMSYLCNILHFVF